MSLRENFISILLLLMIGVSVSLTACVSSKTKPTPPLASTSTMQPKQTDLISTIQSPFSSPVPTLVNHPENLDLPTPAPGFGVVYGEIEAAQQEEQRIWEIGSKIYLAPLIYARDNQGEPIIPILGLDPGKDPNQDLKPGDIFVFTDVPPGEYGFILNNPLENYPVPGSHSSGFLIATVTAGNILDVGKIQLP